MNRRDILKSLAGLFGLALPIKEVVSKETEVEKGCRAIGSLGREFRAYLKSLFNSMVICRFHIEPVYEGVKFMGLRISVKAEYDQTSIHLDLVDKDRGQFLHPVYFSKDGHWHRLNPIEYRMVSSGLQILLDDGLHVRYDRHVSIDWVADYRRIV